MPAIFDNIFFFFEILTNITFLFHLNSVLKIEIFHNIKTAPFIEESQARFCSAIFPQMYTAFKGFTPKIS